MRSQMYTEAPLPTRLRVLMTVEMNVHDQDTPNKAHGGMIATNDLVAVVVEIGTSLQPDTRDQANTRMMSFEQVMMVSDMTGLIREVETSVMAILIAAEAAVAEVAATDEQMSPIYPLQLPTSTFGSGGLDRVLYGIVHVVCLSVSDAFTFS